MAHFTRELLYTISLFFVARMRLFATRLCSNFIETFMLSETIFNETVEPLAVNQERVFGY